MKGVFEKKEYFALRGHRIRGFRGFSPMFHPHGELIYVVSGELCLNVDGERILLGEGELSVIFPYLVHSYEKAPEAEVLLILFDPVETAFDTLFLAQKPTLPKIDGRALLPLLERVIHWNEKGRLKTAMGYFNAVLGEYLELVSLAKSDRRTESAALRVLAYCSEHFTEDITVKSVADALYVSQSYVSKIFSGELNYGFREYVNSLRIQKACSLLLHSQKKIVDIMLDCGFQNQSSFNRVFRGMMGLSPAAFRAEGGEKKKEDGKGE